MTKWLFYRNTTQEIINARKQKKSSGKVYLNFLVIVRALVISGQPIFLPRDANFLAKLPFVPARTS